MFLLCSHGGLLSCFGFEGCSAGSPQYSNPRTTMQNPRSFLKHVLSFFNHSKHGFFSLAFISPELLGRGHQLEKPVLDEASDRFNHMGPDLAWMLLLDVEVVAPVQVAQVRTVTGHSTASVCRGAQQLAVGLKGFVNQRHSCRRFLGFQHPLKHT